MAEDGVQVPSTSEGEDDKSKAIRYLEELSQGAKDVNDLVTMTSRQISVGELSVEDGNSLLDVKNQLMLKYMMNLVYLMMLKTNGLSIEGESAIKRLTELRVVVEKIRPIEQKLKYQIDKYIKIALTGESDQNDPSRFRANPSSMLKADDDDGSGSEQEEEKTEKAKDGVYVPPKLAAVYYDDENEKEKQERLVNRARRRALNTSIIQELKEEYLDVPTEVKMTNTVKQKLDLHQKEKQEYEETYFTRLPVTREEKKRTKRLQRLSTLGVLGDEITHFEDISVLEGNMSGIGKKRKAKVISSKKKKKGIKRRRKFH